MADEDGIRARREAHELLKAAEAQGVEVSQIASALRILRERNHFGEMLLAAMRGRR